MILLLSLENGSRSNLGTRSTHSFCLKVKYLDCVRCRSWHSAMTRPWSFAGYSCWNFTHNSAGNHQIPLAQSPYIMEWSTAKPVHHSPSIYRYWWIKYSSHPSILHDAISQWPYRETFQDADSNNGISSTRHGKSWSIHAHQGHRITWSRSLDTRNRRHGRLLGMLLSFQVCQIWPNIGPVEWPGYSNWQCSGRICSHRSSKNHW